MGPLAFDVQDVSYAYKQVPALNGLSLQIRPGERVALLGANGSGKSTLLRLLAGLSFPDRGAIHFFGEQLTPERLAEEDFFFRFRRRLGIIFQNSDVQLFSASVMDEVAFGPLQLGWPKEQVRERVEAAMSSMGIGHLRDRPPHRLSGGEKKRVALASVLVINPEVLLLDEPVSALDPASQTQMIDLLSSWTDGSRTVITATHELAALESIADRCYVLAHGKVVCEGQPLALLHDARLLQKTSLLRPHRHTHAAESVPPHPHVHAQDL
jgi:cobalt/nickel transport system ATP-binding protein